MKTKHLLFMAVFFIATEIHAQSFLFAKQAGGGGDDWANGVASDNAGNTYVTGYFNGTADFDTATVVAKGTGNPDIFLAKYNSAGKLIWVTRAGGTEADEGNSVCVDQSGNIYITGYYNGSADFGSVTLLNGNGSGFLAKYNSNGDVIWAESYGNAIANIGAGLYADINGYIYIIGNFQNQDIFGNDTITSEGYQDIFIAKCDTNGNWIWGASIGDTKIDFGYSVCSDSYGNAYIAGTIMDLSLKQQSVIAKYSPVSHSWQWAKQSTFGAQAISIACDQENNIYVTGFFQGPITFDTITLNNSDITTADIFLAKFDSAGNTKWAKSFGGIGYDEPGAIAMNKQDQLLLTGFFADSIFVVSNDTLKTASQGANTFIAKFDANGVAIWSILAGTPAAYPTSICLDLAENPIIAGYFGNQDIIGDSTFVSFGADDIFILKMMDNGTTVNIKEINVNKMVSVYPNPATNQLTIHTSSFHNEAVMVSVMNVLGQNALSSSLSFVEGRGEALDISKLAAGMYFLQLKTESGSVVKKFVKE